MSRIHLLAFSSIVLLAACSERAIAPTAPSDAATPSLSKSGTLGNPQFAQQFTTCTPGEPVPSGTTQITCNYKITGGGNTASATISLTAPVLFNGECRNHGGQIVPVKDFSLTINEVQPNVQFQNGQISGSITLDLSQAQTPSAASVCPNGNWTVIPESFAFAGRYQLSALIASGNSSLTIFSQYTL